MNLWKRLGRAGFLALERLGLHVLPVHYALPVPRLGRLLGQPWPASGDTPGIDYREAEQLALLEEVLGACREEFALWPERGGAGFHVDNGHFEHVDAEMLHGLLRRRRPRRFVEAGSGFSTLVALGAAAANARDGHPCRVESWDPFAGARVRAAAGPGFTLHPVEVQRAPLETFASLEAGDVLFVDSSHVLQVGSDVRFLMGEVLPRLRAGVLVHVHDVFLPADYPRYWVEEHLRFWNEQYLLQAFLSFNPHFRVVWGSAFMMARHAPRLVAAFPGLAADDLPASFWFERVS